MTLEELKNQPDEFIQIILHNKKDGYLRYTKNNYPYYLVKLIERTLFLKKRSDLNGYITGSKKIKQIDEITHSVFSVGNELLFKAIATQLQRKAFKLDEDNNAILNGYLLGRIVREVTTPYKYKNHTCNCVRFFTPFDEDPAKVKALVERYFVNKRKIK
jgi:poly(3-hydroxyalkanoate) synthetase